MCLGRGQTYKSIDFILTIEILLFMYALRNLNYIQPLADGPEILLSSDFSLKCEINGIVGLISILNIMGGRAILSGTSWR